MSEHTCRGCDEYEQLSRRRFLGASAGSAAFLAALGAPAWLPRVAFAEPVDAAPRDVLIVVFLRGGSDGLSMVFPYDDPAYAAARPTIGLPPPGGAGGSIDLNGFFGLAPALAPLHGAYQAGKLAIVHATGLNDPTRSHFEAQRFMELGKAQDTSLFSGWIGRHLLTRTAVNESAAARAIALGFAIPTALLGHPKVSAVPDLAAPGLAGSINSADARLATLGTMFDADTVLKSSAEAIRGTVSMLSAINFAGYVPASGAVYPETSFGYAIKSAAALTKAQVGVEAIAIDLQGWDTHNEQGPVDGPMSLVMDDLARGVAAFYTDVIANAHPATVIVMSEFGRRVAENASLGTDHGHGNCMFLVGQRVVGGRVVTVWPGLTDLHEGLDLKITIDYRDVLAEVLQKLLGNKSLATVFPGFTPTFRGLVKRS